MVNRSFCAKEERLYPTSIFGLHPPAPLYPTSFTSVVKKCQSFGDPI